MTAPSPWQPVYTKWLLLIGTAANVAQLLTVPYPWNVWILAASVTALIVLYAVYSPCVRRVARLLALCRDAQHAEAVLCVSNAWRTLQHKSGGQRHLVMAFLERYALEEKRDILGLDGKTETGRHSVVTNFVAYSEFVQAITNREKEEADKARAYASNLGRKCLELREFRRFTLLAPLRSDPIFDWWSGE